MSQKLANYLRQRTEGPGFLLSADLERTLGELFVRPEEILPRPYRVFHVDEAQPPSLGFPIRESHVLPDLSVRLERWITEELKLLVDRDHPKDRSRQAFTSYANATIRIAENALLSNLLADYHGIFWLAHSFDLARQFASIPRRLGMVDAQLGRNQGEALKYRLYGRWASAMREQVMEMSARVAVVMEGEQDRSIAFFRLLQDNVLIFTEEFVGPDLRELRSFVNAYLHKDHNALRTAIDRLGSLAGDLLSNDPVVRNSVRLLDLDPDQGMTLGLLLNSRFLRFLLDHPEAEGFMNRDERELILAVARRLTEFAVLHQLRRGIIWISTTPEGDIVNTDRRGVRLSTTTRPIDFGHPGVVDPMVHRFGLMYDISSFSEILGNLARSGRKGELGSYRQMVLFHKRIETIAQRHRLQFEKFLGDGAFYTTRKPLRLVLAAIEIQRFYSDLKRRGFAFNRGLRIAVNHGYYRLLPMKPVTSTSSQVLEFYGPGIVELSRLTTGKATREIEEIQGFLISHGYDPTHVQQFFAPLARGVDTVDRAIQEREFYAYVNSNGHLMNEGIVASSGLCQELSIELHADDHPLFHLRAGWGEYVGFRSPLPELEFIGLRLLGMTSLKGLDEIEVTEIVGFRGGEVSSQQIESAEPLLLHLRTGYHRRGADEDGPPARTAEETSPHADYLPGEPIEH
jgi:hypothetical protein